MISVSERFHVWKEHADAGAAVDGVDRLGEKRGDGNDFEVWAEWFDRGFDGVCHEHSLDFTAFDAGNSSAGEHAVGDRSVDFECTAGFEDFGHAHE